MPGDRAVTPVVEKVLTVGIVVLFVGATTTALFGGVVPSYRTAVGAELGDRVLSTAAERIEAAVPPNGTEVRSRTTVDLPATIRGTSYRIGTDGRAIRLEHPDRGIGGRATLAVPDYVDAVHGGWQSGGGQVVRVVDRGSGLRVELVGGAG